MKTIRKLLLSLVILTYYVSGFAQNGNSSKPFFFIQMTDPQFGMIDSDKGFAKETELYEKAVSEINRLHPDFVVITGDLVNKKDSLAQVAEFKRITAKINKDIPVWFSPGNHDIGQAPTQKDIDAFISDYGHDRFSFKHNKSLFIGLNSCLIKSNTPILEQKQFEWLKKELRKGKNANRIVLFTHYPFFINAYDETESYSNIAVETRNKYLTLFKEYHVEAVFAGHLHKNATSKYDEMDMTATSAVGQPHGEAPSGFRIIKVYPDRIESVFYGLNEIPEKVELIK